MAARLLRAAGGPDVHVLDLDRVLENGFKFTGTPERTSRRSTSFGRQFLNSLIYGGLARCSRFLIGFPVAYTIAFRGGRYKNLLLFLVIAPFFTSFLIRTISWKILLGDEGPLLGPAQAHARHVLPGTFTSWARRVAQSSGSPTTSCRS